MKQLFTQFLFLCGLIVYIALLGNRSGAPAGRTGAPGETTCGTSSCHDVESNLGSAIINLSLNEGQTTYQVGEIHQIAIAIDSAQVEARNGFEIVALDAQNNNVGEWIIAGGDLRERSGGGRNYITHTTDGSAQSAWTFDWSAPAEDAGAVTFYVAVNDANDNGGRTGDDIYTTTLAVEAEVVSSVEEISSLKGFSIYPNPVDGQLNLQLNLTTDTNLTGTVRNLAGQSVVELFQGTVFAGTSIQTYTIPQNLTQGHYFLELRSSEGAVKSIPLIKK